MKNQNNGKQNSSQFSLKKNSCAFTKKNQVKFLINSDSEYPIVDGKISIDCYLEAVKYCYTGLKQKLGGKNILRDIDYFCFHSPFYKMVQKAFSKMAQT